MQMVINGQCSWKGPLLFFFIHLFLAVLGLCHGTGFSLVAASRDYSLVLVHGLLIAMVSLVAEHWL